MSNMIGKKVYWLDYRRMQLGVVAKETPKLYILEYGSGSCRSQVHKDKVIPVKEACKIHLENATRRLETAKTWLLRAQALVAKELGKEG